MARDQEEGGLVWSSEFGRMCPECSKPLARCTCKKGPKRPPAAAQGPAKAPPLPADGCARVFRETKGRKGKGVSIIRGVPVSPERLEEIAKELKKKCGAGGTCVDGAIEIQGDHRDFLVDELIKMGFKAKKAGG